MDQLNLPEEAAISLFSGNLRPEFKDMQILTATSILHVFDAALLKESLVRETRDSVPHQLQSDVQALKEMVQNLALSNKRRFESPKQQWSPREGGQVRCFGCNQLGHVRRNCPGATNSSWQNRQQDNRTNNSNLQGAPTMHSTSYATTGSYHPQKKF